ncbi:MAG TPA: hypothetical protein VIM33_04870 [Gaiellaceae bacterium]|jgi:hypothetical protein
MFDQLTGLEPTTHLHHTRADGGYADELDGDRRHYALGSGAVYERNLPPPGTFVIDPVAFAIRTSRNRKPNATIAWPGYGAVAAQRIDAVGIVASIFLSFVGTITSPATAPVGTRAFPWNLIQQLIVSANGINNLFACEGADLRALMRVRNAPRMLFDRESSFVIPAATLTNPIALFWEIPLAFDESLAGSVFAQTEETFLNVQIQTNVAANLFTVPANLLTVAGNFRLMVTFYSIPIVDSKQGRQLVLPDITQLHGVVNRDDALTGAGQDHVAPLTRTGGILLRSLQRFDNPVTAGTDIGTVDPAASLGAHKFRYGGNVVPIEWAPVSALRVNNEMDYNDAILPTIDAVSGGAAPAYLVDDFVVDSPMRDAIHMLGITEAQMVNSVNSGVTINAGAKVHTVQEAMVAS